MNKTQVVRALMATLQSPPYGIPSAPADKFEFRGSAGPADRLTLRNACVCEGLAFRVASDLDLTPEILVLDFGLGTIGLVHLLDDSADEPFAERAKRHVDQATYLRHLLMTDGVVAGIPEFRLDYTVESVLAIDQARIDEMVQVVRDIGAKTRFLHATGLNLLAVPDSGIIDPADVRRAFAWLLPFTRQRLTNCAAHTGPQLSGVELLNYRLPGRRPWSLVPNRVHLLHGANGTGKSSIAEALELVVTGSVERIKSRPNADYSSIIRNATQNPPYAPSVALSMADGTRSSFTVIAAGIAERALQPSLPVTAFRLDQTAMDQLIRADSQQRAGALTRAFFPGDAYDALERAQREFNAAFRDLPVEIQQQIRTAERDPNKWHTAIAQRLEWVDAPTIGPDHVAECLPLTREHLEVLACIVREINDHLDALAASPDRVTLDDTLTHLDEALARLRDDARHYREAVVQSLAVLRRMAAWAPSSERATRPYSEVLRSWSDHVALADVLQKHLEISRTLLAAREGSWTPDEAAAGLLSASPEDLKKSLVTLTRLAAQCAAEEQASSRQLQGAGRSGDAGKPTAPSTLTAGEVANLNLIGSWFAALEKRPPKEMLGDAIQAAISGETTSGYGSITIGSEGWTTRVVEFLAPLEPALNAVIAFAPASGQGTVGTVDATTADVPVYRGPVARMHAYRVALDNARKVADAGRLVERILVNRLAEHHLNDALDEVITLFTPARWAYEGLFVNTQVNDGKVGVDLLTARTRSAAEMRLNTAELNLVVLGLYLMCGPTIDNPLGTLLFDDPLQNMDELTSATVARGVAKVAALLAEGWQLILMFHGEEDLETFRREVPASVYYLPWLGPTGAGHANEHGVRLDTSRTPPTPRALEEVVERRVKRVTPDPGVRA